MIARDIFADPLLRSHREWHRSAYGYRTLNRWPLAKIRNYLRCHLGKRVADVVMNAIHVVPEPRS